MSFTQIAEIQQVYDQVEGLTTRSALPSAPPLTRRGQLGTVPAAPVVSSRFADPRETAGSVGPTVRTRERHLVIAGTVVAEPVIART